jgi:alkanesulfonate monooxygenase SsuD/methylene tetrahydromethanopterin reductase-like flavin-dependent oxidoreductase (luciferase family)
MGYDWCVTSLRLGLKLSQNATIDQLRGLWRLADEAGFDSCWVMDHFATLGARDDGPIFETWTMLAAMAQLTTRTRIGCAVVGNTYRHPAVLAKMAVTVDHVSGGRLEFGIGAGWAQNEHTMLGLEFGTRNDRADRLEESVQIIRSLWTQPRTTFEAGITGCRTPSPSRSRCSSLTRRSGSAARARSGHCGSPRSTRTCGTRRAAARRRWPRVSPAGKHSQLS